MDRETKLHQMEAMRIRIEELSDATREGLKTRDQVVAIRKALGSLATVLERLSPVNGTMSSADVGALRDVCKQLRRL
jgi:hypothetical protein